MPFRFLELPREIRNYIYAYSLRGEPVVCRGHDVLNAPALFLHECLVSDVLCLNKQINQEYSQIAHENMFLVLRVVPNNLDGIYKLPSLLSYSGWPQAVFNHVRNASIRICYEGPMFNKVQNVKEYVSDLHALQRLEVGLWFMAEPIEHHCPSDVQIPSPDKLVDLPKPSDKLKKVESNFRVISHLFHQNRSYHWNDSKEAILIGDMWLHPDNIAIFRASSSHGPHNWHGLDLEYDESFHKSWDELWNECAADATRNSGPYIT